MSQQNDNRMLARAYSGVVPTNPHEAVMREALSALNLAEIVCFNRHDETTKAIHSAITKLKAALGE